VKIVEQPQDLTIRVKEEQFTVTLCCKAESPHDLTYKWYCLDDNENSEPNKTFIGSSSLLKISMSLSINAGRRFYCEVSAGGYTISSNIAEIKLETGMFWLEEFTQVYSLCCSLDCGGA